MAKLRAAQAFRRTGRSRRRDRFSRQSRRRLRERYDITGGWGKDPVDMRFDIFMSICQTEVDGVIPNERTMFRNFFEQVRLADELGFGTAWVAETHLSCQIQKRNPGAVIPQF